MTSSGTVRHGTPAILLVEDDAALADLIKGHLDSQGFEVIHVPDSMSALALLEAGRKIDVLLTDVVMPKGTPHGVSLALMAQRIARGLEIVFITGHPDLLEEVGELPGTALVKPFDLAELTRTIRQRLGE